MCRISICTDAVLYTYQITPKKRPQSVLFMNRFVPFPLRFPKLLFVPKTVRSVPKTFRSVPKAFCSIFIISNDHYQNFERKLTPSTQDVLIHDSIVKICNNLLVEYEYKASGDLSLDISSLERPDCVIAHHTHTVLHRTIYNSLLYQVL